MIPASSFILYPSIIETLTENVSLVGLIYSILTRK